MLNNPELWLLTAVILGVAIVGKYFGTYCAARSCNLDRQEASALGWLMNTRGLTELIVLNIGLELGVISPILFTMLVIMALVTTFMTSPLLEWTDPKQSIRLHTQPSATRAMFQPIVQIGYDVSQETAVIAALDRANLVLIGWHRPTFTNNRLGGRVGKMLGTTPADVAVFIDAHRELVDRSSRPPIDR